MIAFEMSDLGIMHYFLEIEVVQVFIEKFLSLKKGMCKKSWTGFRWFVRTPYEFGVKLNKDIIEKKVDDTLYKQIVEG